MRVLIILSALCFLAVGCGVYSGRPIILYGGAPPPVYVPTYYDFQAQEQARQNTWMLHQIQEQQFFEQGRQQLSDGNLFLMQNGGMNP